MARRCISSSRKFGKKIRKKSSRRGRPRRRRTRWSRTTHRRSGGTTEYTTTFKDDPFSGFVYYFTSLGVENDTLSDLEDKRVLEGGEKKYRDQLGLLSTLLNTTIKYYDEMTLEEKAKLLDPKQFTAPYRDLKEWIIDTYDEQEYIKVKEMRQCIDAEDIQNAQMQEAIMKIQEADRLTIEAEKDEQKRRSLMQKGRDQSSEGGGQRRQPQLDA